MINEEIKHEAVNKSGWTIECQSPLEVSYDENFAKHDFAQIVIDNRINEIIQVVVSEEIEQWTKRGEEIVQLHDFLGFTWEEYKLYANYNIIPNHKKEELLTKFLNNPQCYLENL